MRSKKRRERERKARKLIREREKPCIACIPCIQRELGMTAVTAFVLTD
jgi:hypothetical protein